MMAPKITTIATTITEIESIAVTMATTATMPTEIESNAALATTTMVATVPILTPIDTFAVTTMRTIATTNLGTNADAMMRITMK